MRCIHCHTENPEAARFCIECGAVLKRSCTKCQLDNLPQAKYCAGCGSSLIDSSASQAKPVPISNLGADDFRMMRGARDGERRHLTVLFCDLVGSTAVAARIDPEEWRETVAGYHRAAAEAILRFGGYVAKYLGDGVMAFFGWPEAHDNDAERAVRGGLVFSTRS
jgi:Double zinc ribbon/Adenylate and Guanylate cyclase catalytic domain